MNITVVGMGYVGLVTAACFAEIGHSVTCFDIDEQKISQLSKGEVTIFEPGLKDVLERNLKKHRISFTTFPEVAYHHPECVFMAVGTPKGKDGDVELSYIKDSIQTLTETIKNNTIVAIKSTVPVGTCETFQQMINDSIGNKYLVKVVSNPEFLREGSGIYDTFHADRIIVGTKDDFIKEILTRLYRPFNIPILFTEIRSAEMIKYASNAFLATKISFINEIANICEISGADIDEVSTGVGLDRRIGSSFLQAGIGYGGSCFPKDTVALEKYSTDMGYSFEILKATMKVNERQKHWIIKRLLGLFQSLQGIEIAVLGLTFKPFTDDLRGAISLEVVRELENSGAEITVFDPVAVENFRKIIPNARVAKTIEEAIINKSVVLILTEWPEIKEFPIQKYSELMRYPIVLDGRNCLDLEKLKKADITYISVGRKPINAENLYG